MIVQMEADLSISSGVTWSLESYGITRCFSRRAEGIPLAE